MNCEEMVGKGLEVEFEVPNVIHPREQLRFFGEVDVWVTPGGHRLFDHRKLQPFPISKTQLMVVVAYLALTFQALYFPEDKYHE